MDKFLRLELRLSKVIHNVHRMVIHKLCKSDSGHYVAANVRPQGVWITPKFLWITGRFLWINLWINLGPKKLSTGFRSYPH